MDDNEPRSYETNGGTVLATIGTFACCYVKMLNTIIGMLYLVRNQYRCWYA